MSGPIAVKQVMAHDRWLFVVDGAGGLWFANIFGAVEGYGVPRKWEKIELPEVPDGSGA